MFLEWRGFTILSHKLGVSRQCLRVVVLPEKFLIKEGAYCIAPLCIAGCCSRCSQCLAIDQYILIPLTTPLPRPVLIHIHIIILHLTSTFLFMRRLCLAAGVLQQRQPVCVGVCFCVCMCVCVWGYILKFYHTYFHPASPINGGPKIQISGID